MLKRCLFFFPRRHAFMMEREGGLCQVLRLLFELANQHSLFCQYNNNFCFGPPCFYKERQMAIFE